MSKTRPSGRGGLSCARRSLSLTATRTGATARRELLLPSFVPRKDLMHAMPRNGATHPQLAVFLDFENLALGFRNGDDSFDVRQLADAEGGGERA